MIEQVQIPITKSENANSKEITVLRLAPDKVIKILLGVAVFLIFVNIALLFVDYNQVTGVIYRVFSFEMEEGMATWFTSAILLICGLLMSTINRYHDLNKLSYTRHWGYLAIIFYFLSMDEVASLHESLSGSISSSLNTGGLFLFAWVIPALFAVAGFLLVYFRFTMHLPPKLRTWFIGSLFIYIFGALGMEMLSGLYLDGRERDDWFALMALIEETMEMLGACGLAYMLMIYVYEFCTVQLNPDEAKNNSIETVS